MNDPAAYVLCGLIPPLLFCAFLLIRIARLNDTAAYWRERYEKESAAHSALLTKLLPQAERLHAGLVETRNNMQAALDKLGGSK